MALPERPARHPLRAALALVSGIALALIPVFGKSGWLLIGPWLAQPLFALATAWWFGSRPAKELASRWLPDAVALALLWGSAWLLAWLVLALPLPMLLQTGTLNAALGTSAAIGLTLIVLWRYGPVFAQAERSGGGLADFQKAAGRIDETATARSLLIALAIGCIVTTTLCAGWGGIVGPTLRSALLIAQALVAPWLHAAIHRLGREAPRAGKIKTTPPVIVPAPARFDFDNIGDLDLRAYAAARAGRADEALVALALGADPQRLPDADEKDQRSLPVLAAVISDLSLLRELISRGVDLNCMHAGLTPLLAATRDSWHGRAEAVTMLLANGADARVTDADGNTPLHHAARSSDPAVAARLLDANALVDALNAEDISPLGVACAVGNWRLARFLLDHGARCEPVDGERSGRPALLAAAAGEDDSAGAQLLLKHKAKVDARGPGEVTALMLACAADNPEIVDALLDAGAAVNAQDIEGATALMHAARAGSEAVLPRLAKARPDTSLVDSDGRNALAIACASDAAEPSLIRALIGMGADPQQASHDGRRAVDHALAAGRWRLVAELDPKHELPESVAEDLAESPHDRSTAELLRDALAARRFDRALPLLQLGDAIALVTSLLPQFALEADLDVFDWLLANGADPEARARGEDCLFFALLARGGAATGALQRLLDRAVSPAGAGGLARYLHACAQGEASSRTQEQLALALLERGADPFDASPEGDIALHLAIQLGWLRFAKRLLAIGCAPDARDARGFTALQIACTLGREAAVRMLVRAGASPELRTPTGETALGIALAANRGDLAMWLDWRGWRLPLRALQPTDLPAAAMVGDAGAVQRLLDLGLPIDAVDSQGCTALLRAAGGGQLSVVEILLQRGADAGRAAATGATALSAAVSMRHPQIVELLLAHGAQVDQPLSSGVTPLMLAAALGLPEMVARLLAHRADLQRRDERGLNALHCAANYAFQARERQRVLALLDTLLLSGADADAVSKNGQTPLMLLLGAGVEPGTPCDEGLVLEAMEYLLNEGVSLEARDHRGFTPIHLAALHGLARVVKRLIAAGAERRPHDALGRTPYDLALSRGYVDIAAEFEPLRSGTPAIARFLREPRS
jgi:ankyrin repeat protein